MGKSVSINIKTDKQTKEELKRFADEIGLPVSSLVNALIKQIIRDGRVTFDSSSLNPTPYLEGILKEAKLDYKTGKNIHGPFDSAEEMIAELEK